VRLPRPSSGLTAWSLVALALGCVLGAVGHATGSSAIADFARALEPLGAAWLWALKLLVLPLVVLHVMAAIVSARESGAIGGLAVRAVLLFIGMLVAVGAITIAVTTAMLARFPADSTALAVLAEAAPSAGPGAAPAQPSVLEWLAGRLPANPVTAALAGNVLPLLLLSMLLAWVVTRLPDRRRAPLTRAIRVAAGAMLEVARWLLWLLPPAVFVLIFPIVLEAGGGVTGFLGLYVAIQCALVLAVTLLLYPLTASLGRISLRDFARGVLPAQLVAASTRSSIASLPALVEGGRDLLRLPAAATGVILPLAVALFKLNRTVSAPLRLLVLAHVYHIPLSAGTVAIFLVTIIVLSFGTVGLPSGVLPIPTLPAYMAAGIPIEGVVILEAVDAIPDIFKTVLNVTGDMSAATILSRSGLRADSTGEVVAGARAAIEDPA
jgi:Na+/H+-dicarboxylate symporter